MARFRRNRSPRVIALTELEQGDATLSTIGTTGMALLEARRLGMPLLDTFVIGAGAFRELVRQALPPGHDPASLLRVIHRPPGLERAARARERLLAVPLPETLSFELGDLLKQFEERAGWGLRVRASSTVSDPSVVAMAGLEWEAFGLRDLESLEQSVRQVWASCFRADSLRYLRALRLRDLAVAVLIE